MNFQAILSALPWVKRVWKILPPPARVVVLILAAIGGFLYSRQGRVEAAQAHELAERAGSAAGTSTAA